MAVVVLVAAPVEKALPGVLLHTRTHLPIPSALYAPLHLQGINNSRSPQLGEWPGGRHVTIIKQYYVNKGDGTHNPDIVWYTSICHVLSFILCNFDEKRV